MVASLFNKKTDSVPGDIPATVLKEFLPEFATPVTTILKHAVETHTWPEMYKKEYHLPLKKVPSPQNEDDIRGIGLTSWVSKQLERLVLNWIWPFIHPHINSDQMGGMPGCSVEHHVIKMLHFILSSMDGKSDIAVLAVPVDFSKAFNRMLHSDILCSLDALNVPKCATKLIKSYLTKRSMCVTYKGEVSSFQSCPGGGPQGGLLTGILFIIQVNKAGSPCVPRPMLEPSSIIEEVVDASTGLEAREEPPIWQNRGEGSLEDQEEPATWMEGGEEYPTKMDAEEEPITEGEEIVTRRRDCQEPANHPQEREEECATMIHNKEPATRLEEEAESATRLEREDETEARVVGGQESATSLDDQQELTTWPPICHKT